MKLIIIFIIFITVSGCSQFALLASGSSLAVSQNTYVKMYNGVDFLTMISNKKNIKKHVYEKTISSLVRER